MTRSTFLAVVFVALACACAASPILAGPREETVAILRSIQVDRDPGSLRAWLDVAGAASREAQPASIALGERQRFRFEAGRDMYLTAVHVDSQGVATVMLPSHGLPNQMQGGSTMAFPTEPTEFHAQPPLGQEVVFVFGTPRAISVEDLGLTAGGDGFAILEDDAAIVLARRLKNLLESEAHAKASGAEIQYRITGRPGVDYAVQDVVDFLTGPRARSVRSSRFGARVHFATNSAELTPESKRLLDVMGEALTAQPELKQRPFVIAGHTDEVGSEASNLELSRSRANSVYEYLASRWAIDSGRMAVAYYGESIPWELGSDPEALKMNRRVEFVFQSAKQEASASVPSTRPR